MSSDQREGGTKKPKRRRRLPSICLRCGYSLRGLPQQYACPECGLAYDGDSVVFRARSYVWIWPVAAAGSLVQLFNLPSISNALRPYTYVAIAFMFFFLLYLISYVMRFRSNSVLEGQIVAVLGQGLFLKVDHLQRDFIPFESIKGVGLSGRGGTTCVECRLHDGTRIQLDNPPVGERRKRILFEKIKAGIKAGRKTNDA